MAGRAARHFHFENGRRVSYLLPVSPQRPSSKPYPATIDLTTGNGTTLKPKTTKKETDRPFRRRIYGANVPSASEGFPFSNLEMNFKFESHSFSL